MMTLSTCKVTFISLYQSTILGTNPKGKRLGIKYNLAKANVIPIIEKDRGRDRLKQTDEGQNSSQRERERERERER